MDPSTDAQGALDHQSLHPLGKNVTLNTQLAELQEAKYSSWSTSAKICSHDQLYPAQRVLYSLILSFLHVSYILQDLTFSQPLLQ